MQRDPSAQVENGSIGFSFDQRVERVERLVEGFAPQIRQRKLLACEREVGVLVDELQEHALDLLLVVLFLCLLDRPQRSTGVGTSSSERSTARRNDCSARSRS